MSFRPLKNKKHYDVFCGDKLCFFFFYDDVRSAVEGLKHDIKTKDLEADNKEDAIKKMRKLVDKWFEDVIE